MKYLLSPKETRDTVDQRTVKPNYSPGKKENMISLFTRKYFAISLHRRAGRHVHIQAHI